MKTFPPWPHPISPPAPDPKRQIGPVTILNVFKSDEIVRFHKFSLGPGVLVSRLCYLGSDPRGIESDSKFAALLDIIPPLYFL